MTTISLDFHDGSVLRTNYTLLKQLKEHYPDLKVSLFHIPFDYQLEVTAGGRMHREEMLETLQGMLDWVELIPHGLTHIPREFEKCDRWTMKMTLQAIDEAMQRDNLPYVKGFCAPFWLWNQEVIDVLDENGWWGAIDRNQPDMLKTKAHYIYSHSLEEPFFHSNSPVWKLHGHMTGPSINALDNCFLSLMKMPHDAQFKFVSEMVEYD